MKDTVPMEQEEEDFSFLPQHQEPEEYDWQSQESTWSDQALHILEKRKWTDCVFVVGEGKESTVFKCHRVLLAKCSSVFEQMLFGPLKEKGAVKIADVEPSIFQLLLVYVYTGEAKLTGAHEACDVYMIADRYMVTELSQQCMAFMLAHVTPAFAPRAMDVARLMNVDDLREKAWQTLLERTDEALEDPEFASCSWTLLHELASQNALHISSEAQLVSACEEWALRELERRDKPCDTTHVREVLGDVFPLLRFCALSVAEFTAGPLKFTMLTSDEKVALLSCISDQKLCTLEGFNSETRKRAEHRQIVPHFKFSHELNNAEAAERQGSDEGVFCAFNMTVDCAVKLCGLRTATKMESCFVTVQDSAGLCVLSGRYDTSVGCSSGGRVEFKRSLQMEPHCTYRVMLSSEDGQCLLATGRDKEARNLYRGINLAGNEFSFVPLVRYLKSV